MRGSRGSTRGEGGTVVLDKRVGGSAAFSCRNVALRRIATLMTAKSTTQQEEKRPEAALVYRDASCPDRWLVGAPGQSPAGDQGCDQAYEQAFTGPNACQAALEFAHRRYGSARFFAV